ncbi:MAG: hypothetical protein R3F53_23100 [Gammaproteobacteria bacterium]
MLRILDLFGEHRHQVATDEIVDYLGVSSNHLPLYQVAGQYRSGGHRWWHGISGTAHYQAGPTGSPYRSADNRSPTGDGEVAARLGLNIMLCRYYGDKVMCADQTWPDDSIRSSYQRGRPMPLFSGATAKTILAASVHLSAQQYHAATRR